VLPCLLTEQDKKSILYREPSIDASYQVSVHLAKQFSEEKIFFRNKPLKLLSQMNQNLVGSILGKSSIKIAHLVPIR
jgi:hypothetical protein